MTNTGYEKEGVTRATIGAGEVVVGGENIEDVSANTTGTTDYSTLNRDAFNVQLITKDLTTGALDFNTTLDNRVLTLALGDTNGIESIVYELERLPHNFDVTIAGVMTDVGIIYGIAGMLIDPIHARLEFTDQSVRFKGSKLGIGDSAITLGNTQIYFWDAIPDQVRSPYETEITKIKLILGYHEDAHIPQWQDGGATMIYNYLTQWDSIPVYDSNDVLRTYTNPLDKAANNQAILRMKQEGIYDAVQKCQDGQRFSGGQCR
jgi:hypothetical protein